MMEVIITMAIVFGLVVLVALILTVLLHFFGHLFEPIPDDIDEIDEYDNRY